MKFKSSRVRANVSWIFIGNVLRSLCKFLLNIYIARKISVYDNGLINYALSIVMLVSGIASLGFDATITKEIVDDQQNENTIIRTAIDLRLIVAIIIIFIIQVVAIIKSSVSYQLQILLFIISLKLLFDSPKILSDWLLIKNRAKLSEVIHICSYFLSACFSFIAIYKYQNLYLYAVGLIIEQLLYSGCMYYIYKNERKSKGDFSKNYGLSLLKTSYPFLIAYLLSSIYAQTDKIMLNALVSMDAVAVYAVAQTLAGAISMIPGAFITGFRADIMEYKKTNKEMYKKRFVQIYAIIFWLSLVFCLFVTGFAKTIILLIYGTKYEASIEPLKLIVWYCGFSYLGSVNNLYIVAEGKNKYAQSITLLGSIINVVLNLLFIPSLGIIGAALATIITQFISNLVIPYSIKDIRGCISLLIMGIVYPIQYLKDKHK